MTQPVALSVMLAHVFIWTFYSTPFCLSYNPTMLRYDNFQRKFYYTVQLVESKFTNQNTKSVHTNKLHSEVVITIPTKFSENGIYTKRKYLTKGQLVLPLVELYKPHTNNPVNSIPSLIRRRRSDSEEVKDSSIQNKATDSNTSTGAPVSIQATDSNILSDSTVFRKETNFNSSPNASDSEKSTDSNSSSDSPASKKETSLNSSTGEPFQKNSTDLNFYPDSPVSEKASDSNSSTKSHVLDVVTSSDIPVSKISLSPNSSKTGVAMSRAVTSSGNALSRSYNPGSGLSKAEAFAKNGGNAVAQAKALENNSSAIGISKGGGHALAASESGRNGSALSTSVSEGNGSSKAVATVLEGHALATGHYEATKSDSSHTSDYPSLRPAQDMSNMKIDFDDPFFRLGFKNKTKQTGVNVTKIQLGRTFTPDNDQDSDVFYINGTPDCTNVPWKQLKEYKFFRTDTCVIVFNYFNCESFYSWKIEPGTSLNDDFVIYSYQLCNENEGGPELNLEFTEFIIGWIEPTRVLKSYKSLCQCINYPRGLHHMGYWSLNNHGNELMAYYESNCMETSAEATFIRGGHSYESRNIYFLTKNREKVQSVGPAKNSTYFKHSCSKIGSTTLPPKLT